LKRERRKKEKERHSVHEEREGAAAREREARQ